MGIETGKRHLAEKRDEVVLQAAPVLSQGASCQSPGIPQQAILLLGVIPKDDLVIPDKDLNAQLLIP